MYSVLYIDDDHEANMLASIYLKKSGYSVFIAESSEQAREILNKESIALIISDVGLPGQSGPEFYRALKEDKDLGKIPFIFVSGHAMGYDESLLEKRHHFMQKPIFFPDLVKMIESILNPT